MRANSLRDDDRGVEGMPIRLVVAVTIGAAAVGLLFPMIDVVEQNRKTEVTVEIDNRQFALDGGRETVSMTVVTEDGTPVRNATILVSGRSLSLADGPVRLETGEESKRVSASVGPAEGSGRSEDPDIPVTFRPTQNRGTLAVDVRVPDAEYVDERANPEITIRRP